MREEGIFLRPKRAGLERDVVRQQVQRPARGVLGRPEQQTPRDHAHRVLRRRSRRVHDAAVLQIELNDLEHRIGHVVRPQGVAQGIRQIVHKRRAEALGMHSADLQRPAVRVRAVGTRAMQRRVARHVRNRLEHRGAMLINHFVVRRERHRVRRHRAHKQAHRPRCTALTVLQYDADLGLVDAQALKVLGILRLKAAARVQHTFQRRIQGIQPRHEDVRAICVGKLRAALRDFERIQHVAQHALALRVQVRSHVLRRPSRADQRTHEKAHVRARLQAPRVVQVHGRRGHRQRRDVKVRLKTIQLQLVRQSRLDVPDRTLLDPPAGIEAAVRHEARVHPRLTQHHRDTAQTRAIEAGRVRGNQRTRLVQRAVVQTVVVLGDRDAQDIDGRRRRRAKVLERALERLVQLRKRRARRQRTEAQLGPRAAMHVLGQVRRRCLALLVLRAVRQHVRGHLKVPGNQRPALLAKVDRHNVVRAVHTDHVRDERRVRNAKLSAKERVQHIRHIVRQLAQLTQNRQRRQRRLGRDTAA